ncbi:hypothetical protein [Rivularia sp. UHCC 0363]|uniref:hypothetical protein n=1 Tax=Rivularia sp. UHCC 0363 TaxID=3110244 RepID=UPI002B1FEF7C|nr:hypothetical protein [Rivularia sp. UHCC 0363]MEA5594350.1 hypothetical protein [Rivularia sp. UHCC 0363]
MKTTSINDSSWTVNLVEAVTYLPDSLPEKTKHLEVALALVKTTEQYNQAKRDDERRGYLMQDIMRLIDQLKIPSGNQRVLKAMTTSQLDAYAEDLNQQLKNSSFKHLSVP